MLKNLSEALWVSNPTTVVCMCFAGFQLCVIRQPVERLNDIQLRVNGMALFCLHRIPPCIDD